MTNQELWEQYRDYTVDLSNNSRYLAVGAAGVSWIFRGKDGSFPVPALLALVLVAIFFVADTLQYYVAARRLRKWIRSEEQRIFEETGKIEGNYDKPHELDDFSYRMWRTKFILLIAAYLAVVVQLVFG